jgi:hypothetical protein
VLDEYAQVPAVLAALVDIFKQVVGDPADWFALNFKDDCLRVAGVVGIVTKIELLAFSQAGDALTDTFWVAFVGMADARDEEGHDFCSVVTLDGVRDNLECVVRACAPCSCEQFDGSRFVAGEPECCEQITVV